jgi:hypothetical protein
MSEGKTSMIVSAICFFTLEGEEDGDKRYPEYEKVSKSHFHQAGKEMTMQLKDKFTFHSLQK